MAYYGGERYSAKYLRFLARQSRNSAQVNARCAEDTAKTGETEQAEYEAACARVAQYEAQDYDERALVAENDLDLNGVMITGSPTVHVNVPIYDHDSGRTVMVRARLTIKPRRLGAAVERAQDSNDSVTRSFQGGIELRPE